jgi:predicted dehydrogenase
LRLALAGLGSAGIRGHVAAIRSLSADHGLTLVAAAEPAAERRRAVQAQGHEVPVFGTAEEMLAAVACDVLAVAAEPAAHAGLVALGLSHGLHVVCEKPLVVTQTDYDRVLREHGRHPDLGVVSVLQYRYSPTWGLIARCARGAARLRLPFTLAIDVQRPHPDPRAASGWRSSVDGSGGMVADHGVHFLALAWLIDERLDVHASVRTATRRGERAGATLRCGSGITTLQLESGAAARHTTVALHVGRGAIVWRDGHVALRLGRRLLLSWRSEALSDRSYVDALYRPFYSDLAHGLDSAAWRARRTDESLTVARALLGLLATAG